AERSQQHVGQARQLALGRVLRNLDDDRLRLQEHDQNFSNARFASVLTATPLGPFGRYGFASSDHAVPAMSRCAHGRSPANSFRNIAAVIEPAARPPVFIRSAISLLI